nr:protein-disulfide reductase DsbD [Kistimonas asteriae]
MQTLFRPFILLLILVSQSVMATGLQTLLGQTTDNDFLPVEEAFQLNGYHTGEEAVLQFTVTPGHYLYRHMFRFQAVDSNTKLGNPVLPDGIVKFDPYQQTELETYPEDIEIRLPIDTRETLPEIAVTFQGCADAGLCYPPHTTNLILISEKTPTGETKSSTTATPPVMTTETRQDTFLASLLTGNSLWSVITLFFFGGLALTFTPCVLPMIPILSTVVIGKTSNRLRIILLTICYVLSMSITFALAGMLMGYFGASLNLQAKLQSPWILVPFALLFAVLALAMFGLFELQLPEKLRDKLLKADQSAGEKRGGTYLGAVLMGVFATLLVSPCVSAPLAGALIYISSTSDITLGGTALFSLGLGMGTPLLLLGIGGSTLLPKSGAWMNGVKAVFGVLMLGVAVWLLERIIPAPLTLLLWGSLLIGSAVYLGALDFNQRKGWNALQQVIGILLLIYGTALFIGGIKGNADPLRPLAPETIAPSPGTTLSNTTHPSFQTISTLSELEAAKAQAILDNRPLLLDFYADWCISCKVIEREVLANPDIAKRLQAFSTIRMDITRNTPEQTQLLNQYQLFGPPAFLFFDRDGQEITPLRLQGEVTVEEMAALLDQALSSS